MWRHPGRGGRRGFLLLRWFFRVHIVLCGHHGVEAAGSVGAYYWASQKGSPTRTGYSPHPVPDIGESPAWSWADPYEDVIRATPLIDDELNVYLSTIAGRIYKFDAGGTMLWNRTMPFGTQVVGSIYEGKFIIATKTGKVAAISMETGADVWLSDVSPVGLTASDTASMLAFDGIVLSATLDSSYTGGGNTEVVAVDAKDGKVLWRYRPEIPVYNFQASTPGDGTVVFQDRGGGLYRLRSSDGSEVWKSGKRGFPFNHTFTTGATVCHDGLVYVTSNSNHVGAVTLGMLHVYQLEDGSAVWQQVLPYEANQAVAVGPHPTEKGRFIAVVGFGRNPGYPGPVIASWEKWLPPPVGFMGGHLFDRYLARFFLSAPSAMAAYDAKTGKRLWHYELPPYRKMATEGDSERLYRRYIDSLSNNSNNDIFCLPDSCSQPVIGPDGTAYQGWQDGRIYAIRDANGDGSIDDGEVAFHQLSDGFQGSMGMAPGLFAAAPCGGGLYVWRS